MAMIDGTSADDFLFGTDEADRIRGRSGDDDVFAGGGDDSVDGGRGNDSLLGESGADRLSGDAGDDTLSGDDRFAGAAADTLTGGRGADTFAFRIDGAPSDAAATDLVADFEGAGAAGGDALDLSVSTARRLVFGGEASIAPGGTLGGAGNGLVDVVVVRDGDATRVVADLDDNGIWDGSDFVVGLAGDHALVRDDFANAFTITGTDAGEAIAGSDRPDTILAGGGNDTVTAGDGNDVVDAGTGDDSVDGGDGIDQIRGGDGRDTLLGGGARDIIVGDRGSDLIDGGAGDDALAGADGDDTVDGGAGDDDVDGDAGNDLLSGGDGGDDMFGLAGDDTMDGDAGGDDMFGGSGDDVVRGGDGHDEVYGEQGADLVGGGLGRDTLAFFSDSASFLEQDTIEGFEGAGAKGGDVIDLIMAPLVFAGEADFDPILGAALGGDGDGATQLVFTHSGGNTVLLIDDNDDGLLDARDFTLVLEGEHDLTAGDFEEPFVRAGTAGDDTVKGTRGDDVIAGLGGDDLLRGGQGADTIDGNAGNDTLVGGKSVDELFGGDGNDLVRITEFGRGFGGAGDDTLTGGANSFADLSGERGRDLLVAGDGGMIADGGAGADTLLASASSDALTGGTGTDLFVFGAAWGDDTILDFADGEERIDLSGSGLEFADLAITERFGDAIVTSTAGEIRISGVPAADISADDFLFG